MPIIVSCDCGKKFRAPDAAAGKRGKCPACGTVLTVPHPPEPEPAPVDPYAVAVAPARDPALGDLNDYGAYDLAPATPPARQQFVARREPDPYPPGAEADVPAAPPQLPPGFVVPQVVILPPERPPSVNRVVWPLFAAMLAAMLPLAWITLAGRGGESARERFERTIEHHPEVVAQLEGADDDQPESVAEAKRRLFAALPDHRIEGALHGYGSKIQWLYALLAAGAFFAGAIYVLPRASVGPKSLLFGGLFTGTLGILLLLAVQWAAAVTYGVVIVGRGIATLLFYIVKFIGFSYRAADDPSNGFLVCLFGYTFGVGLCEELCKALPVLWAIKTQRLVGGWRDACRWGFISGVGFGVAEGIIYSADFYNGIHTGGIYVVRFVSCVALHAVWASAAGIALFRRQNLIHECEHWAMELLTIVALLIVPMSLHGLYNTLLQKQHDVGALFVALASVAWLAWQVRLTLKREDEDPEIGGEAAAT